MLSHPSIGFKAIHNWWNNKKYSSEVYSLFHATIADSSEIISLPRLRYDFCRNIGHIVHVKRHTVHGISA
jgi:hypothetical protein